MGLRRKARLVPEDMVDLVAADGAHGCEMLESGIDEITLERIALIAPELRRALAGQGKTHDCWMATARWSSRFDAADISHQTFMETDAADGPGPGYSSRQPGGYRDGCGEVRRHAWLAIGHRMLVFDPTGHQFDGCGGSRLDSYVVGGEPFLTWRARTLGVDGPSA